MDQHTLLETPESHRKDKKKTEINNYITNSLDRKEIIDSRNQNTGCLNGTYAVQSLCQRQM